MFRGKNHITKIVFFLSSIWGNFVLYGTTLLVLFFYRFSWQCIKVSKYQVDEPIPIAPHTERSIWIKLCFSKKLSVFSRKNVLFSIQLKINSSDTITSFNSYSKGAMFYASVLFGRLIGDFSNKFRCENRITVIVFILDLGKFLVV